MKLRSGRRIVRKKKIYLPTEVWVDVFCFPWITRSELAQMVDQIGNRWFGEQLQFYLHEWGKHTLGRLDFTYLGLNGSNEFPQTKMPEKITTFKTIRIFNFDNRVFNFFRRIQSLLTADTKLHIRSIPGFEGEVDNSCIILGHLLPFIDGVHTLYTDDRMLPKLKSFLDEKFHQIKVLNVMLTRFKQSAVEPTMEWLTSGNEPKPKTASIQFMEATEPSTFALIIRTYTDFYAFTCENTIGEQLCGMRKKPWEFQVFRHQANNAEAGDKLREWVDGSGHNEGIYHRKQLIQFVKPAIGTGNIFALPDLDEEANDEKPSTPKKRRICK